MYKSKSAHSHSQKNKKDNSNVKRSFVAESEHVKVIRPVKLHETYTKVFLRRFVQSNAAQGDSAANIWSILELDTNNVHKDDFKKCQKITKTTFQSITGWSAIEFASWAQNIQPASQIFELLKAKCFVKLGCYKTANDLAVSCLKVSSSNVDAMFIHGLYLYYHESPIKGLDLLQRVLLLDANNAEAKAICEKAQAEVRALAEKERLLKAKQAEGNKLFAGGHYREAHSVYTDALVIDPSNVIINSKMYYNRALTNSKLNGDVWDTIKDCNAAFKADPKYIKPILLRGRIHSEMRNFEESIVEYKLALGLENSEQIKSLLDDVIKQQSDFKLWKSNYYMVLGIARTASKAEIKRAYLMKAKIHHPDRHANASEEMKKKQEARFKEVDEAHRMLSK